jgi:hypothetical protein
MAEHQVVSFQRTVTTVTHATSCRTITVEFRWRGRRHASHAGQSWLRSALSRAYLQRIVSPHFALNRTGRGICLMGIFLFSV